MAGVEVNFIEVIGHQVCDTPYANILAMETELANKTNPLKVILQSMALRMQGRNLASIANPSLGGSSHPEQRISVPQWIENPSQNQGAASQQHVSQNRGNRPTNLPRDDLRNQLSNREAGADSAYRATETHDRFPCFSSQLKAISFPHKFKPSSYVKYDGKIELKKWLCIYSTAVEVELNGGDNDMKALVYYMLHVNRGYKILFL